MSNPRDPLDSGARPRAGAGVTEDPITTRDSADIYTDGATTGRDPVIGGARRDRIRWGPVWAGLVTAIATYVLLELFLVTAGLLDLDLDPTGSLPDGSIISVIAALIAFFIGGLVCGATALWRQVDDGLINGVVLWGLTIVAFIILSLLGSGLALGNLETATDRFGFVESGQLVGDDIEVGSEASQEAAGAALLMLGLTVLSTAAGAAAGAKMWPRGRHLDDADPRRVSNF